MTTLAAIDCGTNSIRLLISRVEVVDGVVEITELHRLMEIVRLGQGVDATGVLSADALARVRVALEKYAELMRAEGVAAVRMVATSATRDARNREEFFAMTREILAPWEVTAEVISGDEEAALSFRGAVDDLPPELGPFCVIDVGGGSTEVIVGEHDGSVSGAESVSMGSVRLTERFLTASPPTDEQVAQAREYVAQLTAEISAKVPVATAHTVVGCAGTFTTLSALAQGLETYDPEAIHLSKLRFAPLRALTAAVIAEDAESLAANPVMHPKRADVFAGGAVIVDGLMDMFDSVSADESVKDQQGFFYISEKDILDGIVASLVDEQVSH